MRIRRVDNSSAELDDYEWQQVEASIDLKPGEEGVSVAAWINGALVSSSDAGDPTDVHGYVFFMTDVCLLAILGLSNM